MGTLERVNTFVGVLAIALFALGVILFCVIRSDIPLPSGAQAQSFTGSLLQTRRWQSIGEVHFLSQAVDVATWMGWTVKPIPMMARRGFRFTLRGRFASSEAMFFVVIPPDQVSIMQQGYPPLLAYSARETQPISTPWPADGSFYGFVRPPAPVSAFPTSISGVALLLLRHNLEEYRPPARVNVELSVAGECLCTDAEAGAQRMK